MRHWCPVRIGLLQAPLEVHGPEKWNRRLVIHGHLVIPTPVLEVKDKWRDQKLERLKRRSVVVK